MNKTNEKLAAGTLSKSVLYKLSSLKTSMLKMSGHCKECDFRVAANELDFEVDYGKTLSAIKSFIRTARAHTGSTGHTVFTTIVDDREFIFNKDRALAVHRIQHHNAVSR